MSENSEPSEEVGYAGPAPSNGRVYQKLVVDDTEYETTYTKKFAKRKKYTAPDPRRITAFIPGLILKVSVVDGQMVKRGDSLLLLEAMKMENDLTAPLNGKIKKVHVAAGSQVSKGQLLLEFR